MSEPLLSVKNLKKHFPVRSGFMRRTNGSVKAVDGLSFDIAPGEVVGLVGESGCGKSTAGRCAIRLLEPTAGSIRFEGQDLLDLNPKHLRQWRRQAQMIFQDPYSSLNPRQTIAENVGDPLLHHSLVADREERNARVADLLDAVGLTPAALSRYPHQFSGGQQQRVCIARALGLQPKLIICDEVVSALDVSVQAQILNLLTDLKSRHDLSYLFISHDLSVVRHICDRVIVLYLGQVVETASTDELFSNPRHPYTQFLLSAIPKDHPSTPRTRLKVTGDLPSPTNPPPGCPFHTRCPHAQPICSQGPPPAKQTPGRDSIPHTTHCILD